MIQSRSNTQMSNEDIARFRERLSRRMNGEFTSRERNLYNKAKTAYKEYMEANDGKDPFFNL